MPGFPAPLVRWKETDNNEKALAGGKLYTYVAGTSTPLATYSDPDLAPGHANTNPVILDAAGRWPVFVQDGVGYKYVLTDALNNTIWTQDNVAVPQILAPAGATAVPPGLVAMWGGLVAPPGWLLCDGTAVARTGTPTGTPAGYSDLFNAIGTLYGNGNGSTTFNLPDMRGRFALGVAVSGTGSTLGSNSPNGIGGLIDHTHKGFSHQHPMPHVHQVPAHAHTVPRVWPGGSLVANSPPYLDMLLTADGTSGGIHVPPADNPTSTQAAVNTDVPTGANGANTGFAGSTADTGTANPPFITFNFIIKT